MARQATVSYHHVFGIASSDGGQPNGPLLEASDGNLYGTTRAGGGNRCLGFDNLCGVVFKMTPDGVETVIYRFAGQPADGSQPTGPLVQGRDGALYGVTSFGGRYDRGTIFRITLGGDYSVLHSFGASPLEGNRPSGGLVDARDGSFYGTTIGGGPNDCSRSGGDCGTIYNFSQNGRHTVVYSFGSSPTDGAVPNGPLIEGSDGNFYGTTTTGGDLACAPFNFSSLRGCGTVFKLTPAGAVNTLHAFGASATDGILPQGPLVKGPDGAFYGTTYGGGGGGCTSDTPGCGTVFRITDAGLTTTLYAFARSTFNGTSSHGDGFNPKPFLVLGKDGNFYGLTESGGANILTVRTGTIFRLTSSGTKTILYSFGPFNDAPSDPAGGLIQVAGGAFYGVTNYNGKLGAVGAQTGQGTIFRMDLP